MTNNRWPEWSPEKNAYFARLWNEGVLAKVIAHELNLSRTSVFYHAKRLKLEQRRPKHRRLKATNRHLRIPDVMWEALTRHCFTRKVSPASYIRYLIRRDLGLSASADLYPTPQRIRS